MSITFHVVSLFPESIQSYCDYSILKRAKEAGKYDVRYYNPIDYTEGKSRVDDKPYGGGPGMVIRAEPVLRAFDDAKGRKRSCTTLFFDCGGKEFDDEWARALSSERHIILLCGRYEGMDARVSDAIGAKKVRVGKATLTGGEIPALGVIDAVVRTIPGALGNEQSLESSRKASHKVYTRPNSFTYKGKKYSIPDVLSSGHHQNIEGWRNIN